LSTKVLLAMPPEETTSRPVLARVVLIATPLLNTVSIARALAPLPISWSPIVVPPRVALRPTLMVAPPDAIAPDSTPPKNTLTRPPLSTCVAVAVPPDETIRAPLLPGTPMLVADTIVLIAAPPEFRTSRPVFEIVVPEATPPLL